MSTAPENEFDLEKLFLPSWAQEPSSAKQYAQYEGREERSFDNRSDRRGRPPRRQGPPADARPREGRSREVQGVSGGKGRPDRPAGPDRRGVNRGEPRREHRPPSAPLPQVDVNLLPDERGVESLARQIKMTGRAYPLFDIAQMILQKPERHSVVFSVQKNAEGQPIQPLFVCALDDSLWLSEDEVIAHVLKRHFGTFYQAERTATEPPKGKYTFVAQCGLSGSILGPPNYHDYQNQLRKIHSERFARMPFETYKARVKIVRDEEVVKKWIDEQSFKTEYLCLNMPEPLRLDSLEAVEKHFREHHKENIVKSVQNHTLSGTAARSLRSPQLTRLIREAWEDQRRFPLQIATVLSQQFATHGLQFFKVNKTITHVSVARPHFLDLEATPVSEGIRRIVDHISSHPKSTRRKLLEALAPTPSDLPAAAANEPAQATPEQTAVNSDLHWLIHQGHVIEFANGTLETAKKPAPRPPRPEPKAAVAPAPPGAQTAPVESAGELPLAGTSPSLPEGTPNQPLQPHEEVSMEMEPGAAGLDVSLQGDKEFSRPSDGPPVSESPASDSRLESPAHVPAEVTHPE